MIVEMTSVISFHHLVNCDVVIIQDGKGELLRFEIETYEGQEPVFEEDADY